MSSLAQASFEARADGVRKYLPQRSRIEIRVAPLEEPHGFLIDEGEVPVPVDGHEAIVDVVERLIEPLCQLPRTLAGFQQFRHVLEGSPDRPDRSLSVEHGLANDTHPDRSAVRGDDPQRLVEGSSFQRTEVERHLHLPAVLGNEVTEPLLEGGTEARWLVVDLRRHRRPLEPPLLEVRDPATESRRSPGHPQQVRRLLGLELGEFELRTILTGSDGASGHAVTFRYGMPPLDHELQFAAGRDDPVLDGANLRRTKGRLEGIVDGGAVVRMDQFEEQRVRW
jgi:hypothetical protein